MAQSGFTPLQIYSSSTASNVPLAANLINSTQGAEMAINIADGKLFYKNSSGVVTVLATNGTAVIGGSTTQVQYNNGGVLAGSANMTFNGTSLTLANDASIHGLTVGLGGGSVSSNTVVGNGALQNNTTASNNTAVGYQAGQLITTGSYNTIIGGFSGNQGGLDIRTVSDYIVLSDGAGNPRGVFYNGDFMVNQVAAGLANSLSCSIGVNQGYWNHVSGTSTGTAYHTFGYNGSSIGSITQAGATGVLYNITSDYRLKNDVAPIQNALTIIQSLNPVSFTWIDGRNDDGFIAHELQAVLPNCVTGEKDAVNQDGTPKYQQMDNSGITPFLTKAIQELNAKITALEAKLGA